MKCTNCGSERIEQETDHYYHNDLGFDYQCLDCKSRFSLTEDEELLQAYSNFLIQEKMYPAKILIPTNWYNKLSQNIKNSFKNLLIQLIPDNEINVIILIANKSN